jgi:hypothetical protein
MMGVAYQAELALDLLERLLTVELAVRSVGMDLDGTQSLQHLWHTVMWDRRESRVLARMVFVFKDENRPTAKSEVELAVATVPFVAAQRTFPEGDQHVLYEVELDVSDMGIVAHWIGSRSPSDRCPACGRAS